MTTTTPLTLTPAARVWLDAHHDELPAGEVRGCTVIGQEVAPPAHGHQHRAGVVDFQALPWWRMDGGHIGAPAPLDQTVTGLTPDLRPILDDLFDCDVVPTHTPIEGMVERCPGAEHALFTHIATIGRGTAREDLWVTAPVAHDVETFLCDGQMVAPQTATVAAPTQDLFPTLERMDRRMLRPIFAFGLRPVTRAFTGRVRHLHATTATVDQEVGTFFLMRARTTHARRDGTRARDHRRIDIHFVGIDHAELLPHGAADPMDAHLEAAERADERAFLLRVLGLLTPAQLRPLFEMRDGLPVTDHHTLVRARRAALALVDA